MNSSMRNILDIICLKVVKPSKTTLNSSQESTKELDKVCFQGVGSVNNFEEKTIKMFFLPFFFWHYFQFWLHNTCYIVFTNFMIMLL